MRSLVNILIAAAQMLCVLFVTGLVGAVLGVPADHLFQWTLNCVTVALLINYLAEKCNG